MKRVGVISDTHLGSQPFPLAVLEQVWDKIDLILHAGDVTSPAVIRALSQLAPTVAVAGNMDGLAILSQWPSQQTLNLEGHQIGLIHSDALLPQTPRGHRAAGAARNRALHGPLCGRFPGADCIVFGHTHTPHNVWDEGILFFNPGACRLDAASRPSTVGLLIVHQDRIEGRILPVRNNT